MHLQAIQFLSQRRWQRFATVSLLSTLLCDPRHPLDHLRLAHEGLVQFRRHSRHDAVIVSAPALAEIASVSVRVAVRGSGGGGSAPEMVGGIGEEVGG